MLTLQQIIEYYPPFLRERKRSILREYLQYKILEIIFSSEYASKLVFLGGTALRIVYGSPRFSEDLDFDNAGITQEEFVSLSDIIKRGLEREGLGVEITMGFKMAYRCHVRFPDILFSYNLTSHKDEKILIHIDVAPHEFDYKPERRVLSNFDVFTAVNVVAPDLLISMKVSAVFGRKRAKGRDYFDLVFLLASSTPNYDYLSAKLGIHNADELRKRLIEQCENIDVGGLSHEVEPFLFDPKDRQRVELFCDFIRSVRLE